MSAWGALVGLVGAAGLSIAIARIPRFRRVSLADRLAPYLVGGPYPSASAPGTERVIGGTAGRLLAPFLADMARRVDRAIGRTASVRRRLDALGSSMSVDAFRQEQVLWAACGAGAGLVVLALRVSVGHGPPVLSLAGLVFVAPMGAFVARDYRLTRAVRSREEQMTRELPAVAELLALAVGAGESPVAALERVTRGRRGELARELSRAVADARAGQPFARAWAGVAERSSLPALTRFVDGMSVALARGTPLADVLRAQALDVREEGRRNLLEAGGKREIAMMVPVVFLVLPVTILFALYPGAVTLTSLSQ